MASFKEEKVVTTYSSDYIDSREPAKGKRVWECANVACALVPLSRVFKWHLLQFYWSICFFFAQHITAPFLCLFVLAVFAAVEVLWTKTGPCYSHALLNDSLLLVVLLISNKDHTHTHTHTQAKWSDTIFTHQNLTCAMWISSILSNILIKFIYFFIFSDWSEQRLCDTVEDIQEKMFFFISFVV